MSIIRILAFKLFLIVLLNTFSTSFLLDGVDYQSVNPKVMLSFPEQSNLMQTYLVSVLNDSVYESLLETFLVVLESNSQGVSVQGISESVVTIVDDDSKSIKQDFKIGVLALFVYLQYRTIVVIFIVDEN